MLCSVYFLNNFHFKNVKVENEIVNYKNSPFIKPCLSICVIFQLFAGYIEHKLQCIILKKKNLANINHIDAIFVRHFEIIEIYYFIKYLTEIESK